MGCPCGCQEQLSFEFEEDSEVSTQVAFENAVEALTDAMNIAFAQGLRDGAKAAVDVSEADSEESVAELSELVEADAVALDSVLAQVQDLMMRLESLEMHLGLKYTP